MDVDAVVRTLRPNHGQPDEEALRLHRRALDRAIESAGSMQTGPPVRSDSATARRLLYLMPVAVVLLAAVVLGAFRDTSSDPSLTAVGGETDQPGEVSESPTEAEIPRCGSEAPFGVEGANGPIELSDGPLPGASAERTGQNVTHWIANGMAVELRWPADPQPLYGDDAATATIVTSTDEGTYDVFAFDDVDLVAGGRDGANPIISLRVSPEVEDMPPDCRIMQMRVVDEARGIATRGISLDAPESAIELSPLITSSITEEVLPSEATSCDGRPPLSRIESDRAVAPSAAAALQDYVATGPERRPGDGPESFPRAGFTEISTTSTSDTAFGIPVGGFPGYWIVVTVREVSDGWTVAEVSIADC